MTLLPVGGASAPTASRLKPLLLAAIALACVAARAAEPPAAAIASAHPLATAAGFEILTAGGNAFDAAVAISAALGVVEPAASGFGGGGFWLLHRASDGFETMLDGRERAPLAARRDMYIGADGQVTTQSVNGPLAAGIPGMPAALDHLAARYGRLPLKVSLAPAIRYAGAGFRVDGRMYAELWWRRAALRLSPAASEVFLRAGMPALPWMRLRQADLACSLELFAAQGAKGFYHGDLAQRLLDGVRAAGGNWSLQDLAQYRVIERTPLRFRYRNLRIVTAPPPSSGGVVLAEALGMLATDDLPALPRSERVHVTVEAMRRAYRDRSLYLGDPDYVKLPLQRLLSKGYHQTLRAGIARERATPSAELAPKGEAVKQGTSTTHFSVLDQEGNYVAATLSINLPFGSGFMVPGTGILLNNEMDDFAAAPGAANAFGLVHAEPNAIAPGKRMLSSMSPTFVDDGQRLALLGTPGGSRIISMVMLAVLDFAEGADATALVSRPRYHHQYLPDVLLHEPQALSTTERRELTALGHELKRSDRRYGNMHAVIWNRGTNRVEAASDPRGIGRAEVRLSTEPPH
ncbi:MAG: gamma-glutamyltransferase [Nevskiales bacterium]